MASEVRYFGIRHHGPGSARQLVGALEAMKPAVVLIEGPSDATELLPMLADPAMVPPVALLGYAVAEPSRASFWPFAAFSPEYQAVCWAVRNGAAMRFIDLPASWRLSGGAGVSSKEPEPTTVVEGHESDACVLVMQDPIGALARAGGYEDGESWWRDVVEENPAPGPIFEAITDAMGALRESVGELSGFEAAREAHMRLEISKASKETMGGVAVVCGAWHVPGLQAKVSATADRALLKGAPREKVALTWAPWTMPRLSFASGYGAGVDAPGWCQHLWDMREGNAGTFWLGRMATSLRAAGHFVSTASLIEAERLAAAIAALRSRPSAGFEELREASVACLLGGDTAVWQDVVQPLLSGREVGSIPANVPLAPLLEDLQREQKRVRLKPEALERELSLDLRSESGLDRSTLLHRLVLLGVPWGRIIDAGRSRGTFRERWLLRWEPEMAVALVENLVHGPTLVQAAAGRVSLLFQQANNLGTLAELISQCLTAQLPDAVARGLHLIERRAGQTSDCDELLSSLPPLADAVRYGQAREMDGVQMLALAKRILIEAALVLPYASRQLDRSASERLRDLILSADGAVPLLETTQDERGSWLDALEAIVADALASPLVSGTAARLLHACGRLSAPDAADLLGRMLSPGRSVSDAADFFEGFLGGASHELIHDEALRGAVDRWILSLDPDNFIGYLPLFRRSFSSLDRMERRRLLDAVFGRNAGGLQGRRLQPWASEVWPLHYTHLLGLLGKGISDE
jgi:hypothetical protein